MQSTVHAAWAEHIARHRAPALPAPVREAVALLRRSGLPDDTLRSLWAAASQGAPSADMDAAALARLCDGVAQAQSGRAAGAFFAPAPLSGAFWRPLRFFPGLLLTLVLCGVYFRWLWCRVMLSHLRGCSPTAADHAKCAPPVFSVVTAADGVRCALFYLFIVLYL